MCDGETYIYTQIRADSGWREMGVERGGEGERGRERGGGGRGGGGGERGGEEGEKKEKQREGRFDGDRNTEVNLESERGGGEEAKQRKTEHRRAVRYLSYCTDMQFVNTDCPLALNC